jgi:hypothetical protein
MSDAPSATAPAPAAAAAPATSTAAETNTADGSETSEDVDDVAEAKQEVKSNKKKFNVKVNNKAREVELDLSNDSDIQKYIEKALGADDRFQEAANIRKAVAELVQELKTNPRAILAHPDIGLDLKAFAQQIINEELQEMEKTPEQKKMEELERKLKGYEEEKTRLEREREEAKKAQMDEIAIQALDEQVTEALSKSDLPKSPYVLKRIADTMEAAISMGHTDVSVEQIIPFVEQQIAGEISRLFDEAPEQTAAKLMEKIVGKKNLDKYRKTRVSKAKQTVTTAASVKDTGAKAPVKTEEAPKKQKFKDVFGRF